MKLWSSFTKLKVFAYYFLRYTEMYIDKNQRIAFNEGKDLDIFSGFNYFNHIEIPTARSLKFEGILNK